MDYTKHNSKVFGSLIGKAANMVETKLFKALNEAALSIRSHLDATGLIPYFTGNLLDSTGIGVYFNGRLISYNPGQEATRPQTYDGRIVWGKDELDNALRYASTMFSQGIWIVVLTAVPYGFKVDERRDFFNPEVVEVLKQELQTALKTQFPTTRINL